MNYFLRTAYVYVKKNLARVKREIKESANHHWNLMRKAVLYRLTRRLTGAFIVLNFILQGAMKPPNLKMALNKGIRKSPPEFNEKGSFVQINKKTYSSHMLAADACMITEVKHFVLSQFSDG